MSNSIFGSFEVGRRALMSHQQVLNTIGHNLANAATPGYTRQRAELVPVNPQMGVEVFTIRRIRDQFLDVMLLDETAATGSAEARQRALARLEAVFNDAPGTGLATAIDAFFAAAQDLSVHPADQALRVAMRDAGERLAATLRDLRQRVDQVADDLTTEIRQHVDDANALLTRVVELNRQLMAIGGAPPPNDLMDQRDKAIADLSQILGVSVQVRSDGSLQVNAHGSGVLLVDGTRLTPLVASHDVATDTIALTAGGHALTPRSGELAAALDLRNAASGPLRQARSDLDALAAALVREVNLVHSTGAGLVRAASLTAANAVTSPTDPLTAAGLPWSPVSGSFRVVVYDQDGNVVSYVAVAITAGTTTLEDVRAALDADPNITATVSGGVLTISAGANQTLAFAGDSSGVLAALGLNGFFTGTDAASIAVDPDVAADVRRIAAATPDADGLVHPGDGSNALALARLRTALVLSGGTETFTSFHATMVGRVGSAARDANAVLDRQRAALGAVEALHSQTSGVSIDEELINMTQAQHAYAAAARFVTTIDEVIQTLLAMAR